MNLSKLTVTVVVAGSHPGIRIDGYPPDSADGGIYVVIPIDWSLYRDLEDATATRALASDLQNAFETMAYMYDYPKDAATFGMFDDPMDLERILRLRAAMGETEEIK